jgi:hypothetical protein
MTKDTICSLLANNGSGISLPTDGAYLVWHLCTVPTALETYANDGLMVLVGSGTADFKYWTVGGSDVSPNPYGGWKNSAVNTTETADGTVGSPTSTEQYIGSALDLVSGTNISKGAVHMVDVIRWGRCEARMNGGETANYATFAGFAAANDASSARWGLIQAVAGGYLWKGLITLGYSSAVDFRDSNTSILIDDTPKCTSGFNKIEIRQSGSRVDWTSISFLALGTQSKGALEVIDNADVNFDGCTFTDMGTFIFLANSAVIDCVFRRCLAITASGAGSFLGTQVLASAVDGSSSDASAFIWNLATDPDGYLDDMNFTKGAVAHHAIEFGTSSPLTMTLDGVTFSGFNASNGQLDSALHIKRTSGTVTIYCAALPSYKSDGATVNIVGTSVSVAVHAQTIAGADVSGARVILRASDGTGPFPYQEAVTSITNAGTTATVSHTGHGMATNDYVNIEGASLWQNNGVFQITYINADSYSYTLPSAPGSSPSGTITATFVALYGTTDGNGDISTSRAYSSAQPVEGHVRKSSGSPYYKTAPLSGEVSSTTGFSATAVMISDE